MIDRNLKLGELMNKKTMTGFAVLALVSAASAGAQTTARHETRWCRNQDGTRAECRDLRQDTREIRADHRDVTQDRREIRQDVRQHDYGEIKGDRRELRDDRHDLNKDQRDRRRDVRHIRK